MKILIRFMLLLSIFGCKSKILTSEYSVEDVITLDSLKFILVNNSNEKLDSLIIANHSQVLENNYFKLKLPKNEKGWSCKFISEVQEYSRNVEKLSKSLESEQRFLNKILQLEKITDGNELLGLKYWKQLNMDEWLTEGDKEWNENLTNYYNKYILNQDTARLQIFKLDSCEIEMYKMFYKSIESKSKNVFYLVKPLPKTPVDLESNISMPFKKMVLLESDNGFLKAEISWDNFIFYR